MKAINQEKTQLILQDLKIKITNLKKNQDPKKKILYPKNIENLITDLLNEGVRPTLISKVTEMPINTLYTWRSKSNKEKTSPPKGFRKLKIEKDIKYSELKSNGQIQVFLSENIKLSVPFELMGQMMQILKEQWHVSSI